jgi:uncharacterized Zn-binding protein involved in type VI secretion
MLRSLASGAGLAIERTLGPRAQVLEVILMKRFVASVAAMALAALGVSAPAAAATSNFSAVYGVNWRGVAAGEFSFGLRLNGATYEATAQRRATGFARSMVKNSQDYTYKARGTVANGQLRTTAYEHLGGKRNRQVKVAFGEGDVVTTANPVMGMGDPPATRAQKLGTVDQVTAIASMVVAQGDPCARTIKVLMDGRARFDFVMRPNGKQAVNTKAFRGDAVRCSVQYKPIAGFSEPQETADMTFLFAPLSGGMYAPIRIEMPTDDGLIVLEAKSFNAA